MIRKLVTICTLLLFLLSMPVSLLNAAGYDFSIDNSTQVQYKNGDDFVTVHSRYFRKVNNKSYYYPATGEKIFHIPDLPESKEFEIDLERQFKKDSLLVKDSIGNSIKYTIEDLKPGEGFYIKVPNYRQTTISSPYDIYIEYKTHDLVRKVHDWIVIQAPALPEDVTLEQKDKATGTSTSFDYALSIVVDSDIPKLAKAFPSEYSTQKKKDTTVYSFTTKDRIGQAPYLEFGIAQVYKFELRYKTPKTDLLIPEKYSSVFKALSTNIYELSLPREFSETNQLVRISDIYPTPQKITKDTEGNILATFEVEANRESEIIVDGYVWVEQSALDANRSIPNPLYSDYKEDVLQSEYADKYLSASNFWEVDDPFIKGEADKLVGENKYLMDVVKADYRYINERLEYDESKITEGNNRIGAKAALQGGGSVCMEYADSMIALLRAQGIAARAALGYANLEELKNASDASIRHQWVQIWIPEYGWLSIDPTFESDNMKIGQEINRVLWETFNGDTLSNIRIYSADNINTASSVDYNVKIYAVDPNTVPQVDTLKTYSDILPISESTQPGVADTLNTFVKATTLGKALVIIMPIVGVLVLTVLLLTTVTSLIRRVRTRTA